MKPKSAPKPYHHGSLREALVTAALTILAESGVDGLTLRACARRAGVSHAAPQHHFATLEDLLAEIAARGFEEFVIRLDAAALQSGSDSPVDRLVAMGLAYLDFAADKPAVYNLMFGKRGAIFGKARLASAGNAAWLQLRAATAAIAGEGEADLGALQVWAVVHGLADLRASGRLGLRELGSRELKLILERLCNGLSHNLR